MGFFVVGFLVSSVGFVLLSYGRKLQRPPQLVAGLILLILPYLVPGILWMLVATAGVVGLMYLWLLREG
jgi:hypothetical protein